MLFKTFVYPSYGNPRTIYVIEYLYNRYAPSFKIKRIPMLTKYGFDAIWCVLHFLLELVAVECFLGHVED